MYDRKDLFSYLVAMRGKHGYTKDVSNVENVDRHNLPLQFRRQMLGKMRSVLEAEMLACHVRMIVWSVKRMRRHVLFKKPVGIPIDFHDVSWYDKNLDMKFMRHSKNGTTLLNTLASVHCVVKGSRVCLGVLLHAREMLPPEVVAALLDMCEGNGIKMGTFMDREFYSIRVMDLLDAEASLG